MPQPTCGERLKPRSTLLQLQWRPSRWVAAAACPVPDSLHPQGSPGDLSVRERVSVTHGLPLLCGWGRRRTVPLDTHAPVLARRKKQVYPHADESAYRASRERGLLRRPLPGEWGHGSWKINTVGLRCSQRTQRPLGRAGKVDARRRSCAPSRCGSGTARVPAGGRRGSRCAGTHACPRTRLSGAHLKCLAPVCVLAPASKGQGVSPWRNPPNVPPPGSRTRGAWAGICTPTLPWEPGGKVCRGGLPGEFASRVPSHQHPVTTPGDLGPCVGASWPVLGSGWFPQGACLTAHPDSWPFMAPCAGGRVSTGVYLPQR